MRAARARGLVPPGFLIDKAVNQLGISAKSASQGGSLVESLVRRTREKGIPGDWDSRARKIVTGEVAPALGRQIAELQGEHAVATDVPGMWSRPHGDEYYRWALKASTTTNMTPDEVHAMGLEQIKALHARMDPILIKLGYSKGSIGERMQALAKDPKYKFSEGDKGRAEILAYIQQRLAMNRAVLPRAFNTLVPRPPRSEAHVARAGAGRTRGLRRRRIDRRQDPGKFWINLRSTDLHSKYSLPDLASHEAIPGHVWQGEYANRLPLIRTMLQFNAYNEGWALYAEQLVDELGVYDDFPAGRLGYLQSIAFRCCRLVVDTGLHAKRWTRQQGVDYFVNVNGSNPLEVRERGRPLLLMAGPGVRLQGRPFDHQPPARQGQGRARAEIRPAGVRRCRGARRQRADGRAGEERRRLHRADGGSLGERCQVRRHELAPRPDREQQRGRIKAQRPVARPIGDSISSLTSSCSGSLGSASARNSRTPRRNTRVIVS